MYGTTSVTAAPPIGLDKAADSALPAAPAWVQKGRVPCLDGLRALAIFVVLFSHFHLRFPVNIGHRGVTLFFVISGFLITLLMLREENRTGNVALKEFYLRRTLRIMPALLFYLLVVFILQVLGYLYVTKSHWIAALTYTMCYMKVGVSWNVEHTWSLAVEEHFYLLWPVLFCFLKGNKAFKVLAVYTVAVPLLRFIIWRYFQDSVDMVYASVTQMGSIALGCIIAYMAQNRVFPKINQKIQRHPTAFLALGTAIIGAFFALEFVVKKVTGIRLANELRLLEETFSDPFSALGFALIILAVAYAKNSVLSPLLTLTLAPWFLSAHFRTAFIYGSSFSRARVLLRTTVPVIGCFRLAALRPALWFRIMPWRFRSCASKTGNLKTPRRRSVAWRSIACRLRRKMVSPNYVQNVRYGGHAAWKHDGTEGGDSTVAGMAAPCRCAPFAAGAGQRGPGRKQRRQGARRFVGRGLV